MIHNSDSLEFLKKQSDFSFDINYSDPPYALGSEVMIRSDGKVDYKNASDFMGKWEMPTGDYWEQWFKESHRTLRFGGTLIMFGMDRQLLLFKYYAQLAGFVEQQSMYWYYISGFPKATDLSRQIEKTLGVEPIGVKELSGGITGGKKTGATQKGWHNIENWLEMPDAQTELGRKYKGYKYSISPLKQCNETIMVFRKPYKSGSCLHDTLAFENGDNECRCGALNIDGNRVETNEDLSISGRNNESMDTRSQGWGFKRVDRGNEGRYPSQTFCDSNTAEVLDKQSGVSKGTQRKGFPGGSTFGGAEMKNIEGQWCGDTGGCSKILHKCNFEKEDYDIYNYQPKVSKSERNAGLDGFTEKSGGLLPMRSAKKKNSGKAIDGTSTYRRQTVLNNHPTLKPIDLNYKILRLYKTPSEQKIVFPFAGAGSEIIGGIKAGFSNWAGCEINPEYIDIANARIEHWTNEFNKKLL